MRSVAIVLCAAGLVLSGCAGQKAARSAAPPTTPTTRPVALDGCVQPGSAQLVDVGGGHQVAVLGTGPVGVVLSNQSNQNLCGWLPFARTLAARGFRVLVYDYGITADPAGDVAKAAATLRELGVRTVMLAGASQGAKASLIAAPAIRPPVGGVVSLSAERTMGGQEVQPFAAKLRAAVLFVVAKGDPYGAGDATPRLYRAATKASSRRLVVVAGDAHGTDLLTGPNGARVRSMIIDFLSEHSHAP
jgi:pimeloyl-ACP methyl ester carboxylesterase